MTRAIIYCRVSTLRQAEEGHGIEGQLLRCEAYARSKGYKVAECFLDQGASGGTADRPQMKSLLQYLDNHPLERFVIIIDHPDRLARSMDVHLELRTAFNAREATLESPNYIFDSQPESILSEHMLAVVSEYHRNHNKRQVIQKQHARIERGYWCFCPPTGLEYHKDKEHGKLLRPKEPEASLIKEALEAFARGILMTQRDVQDFLNARNFKGVGNIYLEGVKRLLTEPLYAGLIEYKPWGITRRKGHHEAIISVDIFEQIERRLEERTRQHTRRDDRIDFPLRRFVVCSECGIGLTGSLSTGRTKQKYPYYQCRTRGCMGTIKSTTLETAFCSLLEKASPSEGILLLFSHILTEEAEARQALERQHAKEQEQKVRDLKKAIQETTDLILRARSNELREAYEGSLELKQKELNVLQSLATIETSQENLENILYKGKAILRNPLKTWQNGSLKDRQMIQTLVFRRGPSFSKENGFGNTEYSLLYRVLTRSASQNSSLVEMPGFEPGYNNENQTLLQP